MKNLHKLQSLKQTIQYMIDSNATIEFRYIYSSSEKIRICQPIGFKLGKNDILLLCIEESSQKTKYFRLSGIKFETN